MNTCTTCGSTACVEEDRDYEISYKGFSKIIKQHAWWCKSCGEAMLRQQDANALENEIRSLKSKVN